MSEYLNAPEWPLSSVRLHFTVGNADVPDPPPHQSNDMLHIQCSHTEMVPGVESGANVGVPKLQRCWPLPQVNPSK